MAKPTQPPATPVELDRTDLRILAELQIIENIRIDSASSFQQLAGEHRALTPPYGFPFYGIRVRVLQEVRHETLYLHKRGAIGWVRYQKPRLIAA
jgi:hypothetical protein